MACTPLGEVTNQSARVEPAEARLGMATACNCDDEMGYACRLTIGVTRVLHATGNVVDGEFEWDKPDEALAENSIVDDDILCRDCWETGEADVEVDDAEVIEDSIELTVTCDGCGAELTV